LVVRLTGTPMQVDWTAIGTFSAAAFALVFVVTALSLLALRTATRATAIRTE
jgi:hypothetical protein